MQNKKSSRMFWMCFIALSALYVAAMLAASAHTSPLYKNRLGWDSAIFSLIGKAITEGKSLYIDVFDHKGPVMFYINALGHLLGGRSGIFVLQCVFGIACLFVMQKSFGLFCEKEGKHRLLLGGLAFLCAFSYFFFTFERGNLTEEYSLIFICIPLYLMCKYAKSTKDSTASHSPTYSFVYGVCFAIVAFLRINNAVAVAAGVLAIIIYLILKKQYASLFLNIGAGLVGVLSVTLPILLFFAYKGSLYEMIYASFLHNLMYNSHATEPMTTEMLTALYSPMLLCGALFLIYVIKNKRFTLTDGILVSALAANALMLTISNQYPHYFAVFVPVYFLFVARYYTDGVGRLCAGLMIACSITSLLAVNQYMLDVTEDHFKNNGTEALHASVMEGVDVIPEEERNSVICFQITPYVYHYADIMPAHRYFTLQKSWAKANPKILDEFCTWMKEIPPMWVIASRWEDSAELGEILQDDYELRRTSGGLCFYRYKHA